MRRRAGALPGAGLAALLAAAPLAAGGLQGPVAGFVADARAAAIRPVNGIPGAALLGAPLALPFAVRQAVFGPGFAVALSEEEKPRVYVVRGLGGESPAAEPLAVMEGVGRLVLNRAASAALLYAPAAGALQIVTGLPDRPEVSGVLDVSALPGPLAALALGDGGTRLLAGTPGDGALYLLEAGAAPRLLLRTAGVTASAFLSRDRDVALAQAGNNEIVWIREVDGAGEVVVLAGERDGIDGPVALRGMDGDRALLVANAGSFRLAVLGLAPRGVPEWIDLPGRPSRCDAFDGAGLLVLNEAGPRPLLLLDLARGRSVTFVPAD